MERPLRLSARFSAERVAALRFVPGMAEVMEWVWRRFGESVYDKPAAHKAAIEQHLEQDEIDLNPKNKKALLSAATWKAQRDILHEAEKLAARIGDAEYLDFNEFRRVAEETAERLKLKLSGPELKQILNAVSVRDERAEKVIKKRHVLPAAKLTETLECLGATADCLPDFGLWPDAETGEYLEYESDSELRDTENVPLAKNPTRSASEAIHAYFLAEVRPHVADAWLDLDKTAIGYEISFNKYFYQHKPLRSLEEVSAEILALEKETDGLLKNLIAFVGTKP